MNQEKNLIGTSILAAIAASLCCIVPILALVAGTSSVASTFSWIEPFRPYLIAITIIILAFAWYQLLKPKKVDVDCECEDEKPKFMNSKMFMFLVTVFAGCMIAFPYYSHIFYGQTSTDVAYIDQSSIEEIEYSIKGMTCTGCEAHIESEVFKLGGIVSVEASYTEANTVVKYDMAKVSQNEIEQAILKTGYIIMSENDQGLSKHNDMTSKGNISFYIVGLVCNAAPTIGCGSRSKPVLLELEKHASIKEAWLNSKGIVIAVVWEESTSANAKNETTKAIFSSKNLPVNDMDKEEYDENLASFTNDTSWLRTSDVDTLSKEEAGVLADKLVGAFKKKGTLSASQQGRLKGDMVDVFYDFFLNFESLDQLSDTDAYRVLMKKITEKSESYIDKDNIPDLNTLLNACSGHSESCSESCTKSCGKTG